METFRPRLGIVRDDVERALIVGAIVVLWVIAGPLALLPLLFAAYAFVLDREGARLPLAASGFALVVWVGLVTLAGWTGDAGWPWVTLTGAGAGLVIAVLALRVRIGSEVRPSGRRPEVIPVALFAAPPSPYRDLADDPPLLTLLDTAAHLDRETTRLLAASWTTVAPADREAAWVAVQAALESSGREHLLEEIRRQVEWWGRAAGGSPWTWQYGTMTDVDRGNIRRAAMPAILDVAAASLVRDRLDPRHVEILAGPWEATLVAEAADPVPAA